MSRRSELEREAADVGLHVRTWSPGDGVTRYRFFTNPDNTYFGPENGIFTALGIKEADAFLTGYYRANPPDGIGAGPAVP